jgi:N-acetylglucosaminyldiphosphoundecaprenol N-acetyl-beta-D-mannosaminyltransferase
MVFPDGVPIAWLGRRAGVEEADRACGIDVLPLVADLGRPYGLRHFLFGSTPETLVALERRLCAAYPGVAIVGTLSPPMAPLDHIDLLDETERIRAADPDIVWCGLGAPKQELWMQRFARELEPALTLGVGAAFDLVGGTKPRAPYWMQRRGLEWLYRLGCEPRRLGGRYIRTNTEFVLRVVRDVVRSETAGRSAP